MARLMTATHTDRIQVQEESGWYTYPTDEPSAHGGQVADRQLESQGLGPSGYPAESPDG